jgi:hypothetical protein
LVEQATHDVASEDGSNSVDKNLLWIMATGGPKRGNQIFGMGSESHSMIHGTTYSMHDEAITSTNATWNVREELRAELIAEITTIRSEFGEKMQQVERSLGEKVVQVESTIEVMEDNINKRIDNLVDKETLFDTLTKALKNYHSSNP